MPPQKKLRVAFLHPDLGLGGAERLVVDAAAGLAARGHAVSIFTNSYDASRSFAETRDGSFRVRVHGAWIPRTLPLLGGLHILLAIAQNLWLALSVALAAARSTAAVAANDDAFDVLICDQVSACVPLLRLLMPRAAVVFYCHFPDQLLAPRRSLLRRLYRAPFDALEELTTGLADAVVVNSSFTRATFSATFRRLGFVRPEILYPCIAIAADGGAKGAAAASLSLSKNSPIVFLSINRYERKKGIDIAIRAMALLRSALAPADFDRVHLVVAGGYDTRVAENVEHYRELQAEALACGLVAADEALASDVAAERPAPRSGRRSSTAALSAEESPAAAGSYVAGWRSGLADVRRVLPLWPEAEAPTAGRPAPTYEQVQVGAHVTFIRSFSDAQKVELLRACAAVVYTPQNEHFGIVPLECMAAVRPVVACSSGGPLESVVHGSTGLLCEPTPQAFAAALAALARDPARARAMGEAGRAHVARNFSRVAFAEKLEAVAADSLAGLWRARAASASGRARLWAELLLLVLLAAAAGPVCMWAGLHWAV